MKRATIFPGALGLIMAMLACSLPLVGTTTAEAVPTSAALPTEAPLPAITTEMPTLAPLPSPTVEVKMPFELTSTAFEHKGGIPRLHACKEQGGKDMSPPLAWGDPPEGTKSFALIMDDPDAPGGLWVHWVLYNIPAEARGLPENVPPDENLPDGSRQGNNSWGRVGYGGPCPPSGMHRYFFKLYALDIVPDLPARAKSPALTQAMQGHILAQLELMGFFSR